MKRLVLLLSLIVIAPLLAVSSVGALDFIDYASLCHVTHKVAKPGFEIPAGFKLLAIQSDQESGNCKESTYVGVMDLSTPDSGFQATAFQEIKTGNIIISFSGTEGDDLDDLLSDLGIGGAEFSSLKNSLFRLLNKPITKDSFSHLATFRGPARDRKETGKLKWHENLPDWLKPYRSTIESCLSRNPSKALRTQWELARRFYLRLVARIENRRFKELHRSAGNPRERSVRVTPKPTPKPNITFVGHSLGGYLVQALCAETGLPGYTFNAPGAAAFAGTTKGNVVNYRRHHDLVGIFGEKVGREVIYPDVPSGDWSDVRPFYILNHLLSRFVADIKAGVKPMRLESEPETPQQPSEVY